MTTINIDPAEIQKFEELANRWWDRNGEFKPLHDIDPLRLNFINTHCPLEGRTALDVGCGGGILSESMSRCGAEVKGIDMGRAPLSIARLHAMDEGLSIDYEQITIEELARGDDSYDVVTCMEMLEHVPDPSSIIDACARICRPGGSVFFSTINRNPKAYLFAILGAEYLLRMLPRGTHEYAKFIRPSELDHWAQAAGLKLEDIQGIEYNPMTKMFRSSDNVDVNYMIHYRKPEQS